MLLLGFLPRLFRRCRLAAFLFLRRRRIGRSVARSDLGAGRSRAPRLLGRQGTIKGGTQVGLLPAELLDLGAQALDVPGTFLHQLLQRGREFMLARQRLGRGILPASGHFGGWSGAFRFCALGWRS